MIAARGASLNEGIRFGRIFYYSEEMGHAAFDAIKEPTIVVAIDLTPRDTLRFGRLNVVGLVVKNAGPSSHTAILSRTMGLPALSSEDVSAQWHGMPGIIDGRGELIVDPDEPARLGYALRADEFDARQRELASVSRGLSAVTKSGKSILIYANINAASDVENAVANGAAGIGNFKTEFMFMEASELPGEEEQFQVYKSMASRLGKGKFVIRTLDIGADKTPSYLHLEPEENPALGYRAIRISLDRLDIFVPQIRAILRASAFADVAIMYPMIVSVDEVIRIKEIVGKVMEDLTGEGVPFNRDIEQGIMIETPAAVLISDDLATLVDFFSIGTNDLTQYMLAIDRTNAKLADRYGPYHPAILHSIKLVVENARNAGTWVSISGELAADEALTSTFLEYGVDALTVSPSKIPQLKVAVSNID
ncbi:phosphoenolpyruvate--protein phosphotransferase [Cryobacterium aureum]|uniref:phosphoenolpyruvate--protein phosphotransferase n=1 Tax=Cryobacterium aureum TaxID=995037 RepID=UPI001F0C2435|nr:phosphoenolpyruvate--protein phosphotransferase [Cryobacterium aureum]